MSHRLFWESGDRVVLKRRTKDIEAGEAGEIVEIHKAFDMGSSDVIEVCFDHYHHNVMVKHDDLEPEESEC